MCRLDARQRVDEGAPGFRALLGAEAHLSDHLADSPAAGKVCTENTGAEPDETAEGNGCEGPDPRRAEQLAIMSTEAIDKCDRDLIHYDTDDEMDSRRFGNGPPGTGRHDTSEERPRDPQQPTPGAHEQEPAGNANPPSSTAMGDSAHRNAAADRGPDARASPAAPPGRADAAGEAPCPQATRQPEAETCAVRTPGGTGQTDARGPRTTHTSDDPPDVLLEERTGGGADDAHPQQPATAEERVRAGPAGGT